MRGGCTNLPLIIVVCSARALSNGCLDQLLWAVTAFSCTGMVTVAVQTLPMK